MSDLIIQEAFNLYVGDAGPDNSKHLIIKNLKLPDFEEIVQAHHSGGSWGEIEIGGLGMKALTGMFKGTGWDVQTMSQFGINGRVKFPFTAYGNARSKATGAAVSVKAVMFGRMTSMKRPEMKRGELLEVDHEIKEMLQYQEWHGDVLKYYWDWQSTVWMVDGVVQNADEIANLGIPTSSAPTSTTTA